MAFADSQRCLVVQLLPRHCHHFRIRSKLFHYFICSISHLNQKEARFIFYFYALGRHSKRLDLMFDPRYDVTIPTKISSQVAQKKRLFLNLPLHQ